MMKQLTKHFLKILGAILSFTFTTHAQSVPPVHENIPTLVTFGKDAKTSFGDDDFCQVFFLVVPQDYSGDVFLRIFDPETSGEYDELVGKFDTKTKFEVYGGKGAITNPDAIKENPGGKYKSGVLLGEATFDNKTTYDGKWYTMGPFNPKEGELAKEYGGYVFKIIAEGLKGDDGNNYKYFLSNNGEENTAIEGSNLFTFEYTFALHPINKSVAHIYPFIDNSVVAIKIHIFDFDNDGVLRLISVSKKGTSITASGDDKWTVTTLPITDEEKKTSVDIQIIKNSDVKNNNIAFYITNQYGKTMPFYTIPIGGIPKFKYKIQVER
jgi:hypothetical protein